MAITDTPQSDRLHIGFFGKVNSGKSSLFNMITDQKFSIVSDIEGTTADPVFKTMEINGLGPVVFIDTAGFADSTELGVLRSEKTNLILQKTDVIVLLISMEELVIQNEINTSFVNDQWFKTLLNSKKPIVYVLSKIDKFSILQQKHVLDELKNKNIQAVCVSSKEKIGTQKLIHKIQQVDPSANEIQTLTGNLCSKKDLVMLVMPQNIQAPKGRLILPQVQVIRELLDKNCIIASCTTDTIEETLLQLKNPPKLIITDSQVFNQVYKLKPEQSLLTSFSVLMAVKKGDFKLFKEGAKSFWNLNSNAKILIAEACTHSPLSEDIGREQIPRMIKKYLPEAQISFVRGIDFPNQLIGKNGLHQFDLIIHCGACMFNRTFMLLRQKKVQDAQIPMTNYGIFLAMMCGILDNVAVP